MKRLERWASKCYLPARTPRLRLFERPTAIEHALQLSPYAHHAGVKIDVRPSQAEQLRLSHACRHGQDIEGFKAIAACDVEEYTRLFPRKRVHLGRAGSWHIDELSHVASDEAQAHCARQRFVQ